MLKDLASVSQLGYSLAGLLFLGLSIAIWTIWRNRLTGGLLAVTLLLSSAWAFLIAVGPLLYAPSAFRLLLAEMLFDIVWMAFLGQLLARAVLTRQMQWVRWGGVIVVLAFILAGFAVDLLFGSSGSGLHAGTVLVIGSIVTSLIVLVTVEQIYRNARSTQKPGLKFFCLAIACIFAYDLFLYSNAILAGQLSDVYWSARGGVVAMCTVLLAVAIRRSPDWSSGVFVSRRVVFYTATIFGTGIYLTAIGFIGYLLRTVGGDFGEVLQLTFFAAGTIALFVFLFSDQLRSRLSVLISKHFFENRYDYRDEWLRLTRTLTTNEDSLPSNKRAILALAQIVDAQSGTLWIKSNDAYFCAAGWNTPRLDGEIVKGSSLPRFLQDSGWVIETEELLSDPGRYTGLSENDLDALDSPDYVIPLFEDSTISGFVALHVPGDMSPLNYEDRDLLKTAGQQVASYLAQERATEQLAESRQFETFNKLTAFLMHDLKNLIAQQALVVENARKHKSNPEFIDDAIATMGNSEKRLRHVVEQLQQGTQDEQQQNVELSRLLMKVSSQCEDRKPVPQVKIETGEVWLRANRDRLSMALLHAVRNAQDAVGDNPGEVAVSLKTSGAQCELRISDNGVGMDDDFVRNQLFKPFHSTKGSHGMGIGAYQLRETVLQLGGEVRVDSEPGAGTTITLRLPVQSEPRET